MDLLQSILRTCDAERYVDYFKNNGIDCFTLKVLDDEDLKIVGVEDKETRNRIIRHVSNLQIPAEKTIQIAVNYAYAMLVLNQVSIQLHKHFANLSYALKRENTDVCNIKLTCAVNCLYNSFESLEKQLDQFEQRILRPKKSRRRHVIYPTIIATAVILLLCKKYVTYCK